MSAPSQSILALSGGVGGAKLALGLSKVLDPGALAIVANTADDFEHLGLAISPDLDTVMYTLAGLSNTELGWGLAGESWQFMEALRTLGGEDWFQLGDKDMATHIRRTQLLAQGESLDRVTASLCQGLGVAHPIIPMSNDPVRTRVETDEGDLPFQRYFVERQCQPQVKACHYDGVDHAAPAPAFAQLLTSEALQAVIICPSNPFLSVEPILRLSGVRDAFSRQGAPVVAVSPIVGGMAIKGPAAKMMAELNLPVSALEVARFYQGLVDGIVIDTTDAAQASSIEALGMQCLVTNTIMKTTQDKTQLATETLVFCQEIGGAR